MIEVEVKVRVPHPFEMEEKLKKIGFLAGELLREADLYFDNKAGSFRSGDKALRLRHSENLTTKESVCLITYKGPKMDSVSMTRKELETEVANAAIGEEILNELGFYAVHPVIKKRQYYHLGKMTACLDQVEGLGAFLELEYIAKQEEEKEEALDRIFALLEKLGYQKEEVIRTSYLSMLMGMKEKNRFTDFYKAYHFLQSHALFEGDFTGNLYVEVVKVNPETETIKRDGKQNTATRVWFETGSPGCHDPELDCGGESYEEAIVALANLVYEKYGDDKTAVKPWVGRVLF